MIKETPIKDSSKISSYRQIVKATAIFGGVQFFQVLVSIIKMKFVAILIGASGIGILGLFTTTTGFITSFTNFGLGTSSVKNIAEANASGDLENVKKISTILKKLVLLTGLFGLFVTIIFSPILSKLAFNVYDYTIGFIILSPTLLISQLSVGQSALLQGMRKIQFLSKSNIISAIIGLVISVSFYYYLGLNGIIPVLILTSLSTLIVSTYFSNKLKINKIDITWKDTWNEGNKMLKMGLFLNLSGVLSVGAAYAIRIVVSKLGGIQEVGFYTAGFTILNLYVGMLTSAIVSDYYPRLSEVITNPTAFSQTVNQQTEVLLLILAPIICTLLIYTNLLLHALYSKEFIVITKMMQWASLGIVFRTLSWAISYIFIAKGDSRLFFKIELTAQFYFIPFQIFGYMIYGLEGIGIAFLISYIVYIIVVYSLASKHYNYKIEVSNITILLMQVLFISVCFLFSILCNCNRFYYLFGAFLIVPSFIYSFYKLDNILHLKDMLAKRFNKG